MGVAKKQQKRSFVLYTGCCDQKKVLDRMTSCSHYFLHRYSLQSFNVSCKGLACSKQLFPERMWHELNLAGAFYRSERLSCESASEALLANELIQLMSGSYVQLQLDLFSFFGVTKRRTTWRVDFGYTLYLQQSALVVLFPFQTADDTQVGLLRGRSDLNTLKFILFIFLWTTLWQSVVSSSLAS